MKYILGICNVIAALLVGYIISINFRHMQDMDADFEAMVTKYKTENAAQMAYMTELYHLGDWPTVMADALAIQNGQKPSPDTRLNAVRQVGTAISFEETTASYLAAFEDDITAVLRPYVLYEDARWTLMSDISLTSGTLIDKTVITLGAGTVNLGSRDELIAGYRQIKNIEEAVPDYSVLQALEYARGECINKLIREAMSQSGFGEKDSIYIPVFDGNSIPGVNYIASQSLLLLNSSNNLISKVTTLAGYTKITKRYYCTIRQKVGGVFTGPIYYCYTDELPAGFEILNIYGTEQEAAAGEPTETVIGKYYINR